MGDYRVKSFMILRCKSVVMVLALVTLGGTPFSVAQTPATASGQGNSSELQSPALTGQQLPSQHASGSISGTVTDQSGAVIAGARVRLTRPGVVLPGGDRPSGDRSLNQEVLSDGDGQFSFANVPPGTFQLTITSSGFEAKTSSGILHSGEIYTAAQIALAVATNITDVEVGVSQTEVAEEQMKVEEQQRVLGVLPNFYVSYVPDAVPLSAKQKFKLAWKTIVDPFTFVIVGGTAGIEQAQNHFNGYGQGAQGYAKRFGANYADTVADTFIGSAILPSLLKQDPRYFYKGTGSPLSRFLYATASSVVCKGDNGHWQANYSNVLGSLAAGGISNLYYPAQDRNGAGLTLENGAIGLGATAAANLFQEFFIRKLTPKPRRNAHPTSAAPATETHPPGETLLIRSLRLVRG
jgi:Carboxypeptidase regulatory-like domain